MSEDESVARLIREAAFTHLNRLVAIRIAEAIGLLPPSLAAGKASQGFRNLLELAPSLAADETGGYWTYLRLCGDELAGDAPALFDPRNPLLRLAPSPNALDELVQLVSDPVLTDAWGAPDALGWTYQFFNSAEERRKMRYESGAPRNSRELAVRNQFFTPRYVVDFLVHNTLGRRLVESDPSSPLRDELDYLVDPPQEPGAPLQLDEVRVLDPACGSGHFLLGAYDMLERAWELQGVSAADAAPRILPTLWGIDIDPRCAQVASATLVLRARRHCRTAPLSRPNVITARELPDSAEAWEKVLAALPANRTKLLEEIREALVDAPVLGSLLKVEERLADAIGRVVPEAKAEEGTLFEAMGVASDRFGKLEAEVLAALQQVADEASSSAAERLLAAEAGDAIRLIEAMRQRYDAVLMNPPFGEPALGTKEYLKAAYPWIPWKDSNLLAAFVGRGMDLLCSGGFFGAITSRSALFLSSFEEWRRKVLLSGQVVCLADFGFGVMEQAQVEAAAYVLSPTERAEELSGTFLRLTGASEKGAALRSGVADANSGRSAENVFRVTQEVLMSLPGSVVSYWIDAGLIHLIGRSRHVGGEVAALCVGLQTGDDVRFLRLRWETPNSEIGEQWMSFAKGGEFSPYWSDISLLVNWEGEGATIRDSEGSYVRNAKFYRSPGLTWSDRAPALAVRVLPMESIFSHVGYGCFPIEVTSSALLAWLNSRLARALADLMTAVGEAADVAGGSPHYTVGLVSRVPWPPLEAQVVSELGAHGETLALLRRGWAASQETSPLFACPPSIQYGGPHVAATDLFASHIETWMEGMGVWANVEDAVERGLGLPLSTLEYLDREGVPNPWTYSDTSLTQDELNRATAALDEPFSVLSDEIRRQEGRSTRFLVTKSYFLDRRLELLATLVRRTPSRIGNALIRSHAVPNELIGDLARDLISYLVGSAFGRWDLRIGKDSSLAPPLPDLFDPLPICPPGMLVGDDGMPATDTPAGYPLELPPVRILVDEPGHAWDLDEAVGRAASFLFDEPDAILLEAEQILGKGPIRDYLRKQFFKDHLSRYSGSRRKAPIYWHLSVPSRKWGLWLYAPNISREMLFGVAREAARREAISKDALIRLQGELAGATGTVGRKLATQLDGEEKLAEELRVFRAEADRIAALGWEPDLDDGISLCAAPLADLFPVWPDAAKERANLRKGSYPWASVWAFAEEL